MLLIDRDFAEVENDAECASLLKAHKIGEKISQPNLGQGRKNLIAQYLILRLVLLNLSDGFDFA